MADELIVKYIKRKNKIRKIVTYADRHSELRRYHEAVVDFLEHNTYTSKFAKAYAPKSSIFKNATAHMFNDYFIKLDIYRFFPSINLRKLEEQLYKEINKTSVISRVECHSIVDKCSFDKKGLPLGLVASPALANLYLKEFDGIVYGRIKKLNLRNPIYTRYADDLVISYKLDDSYSEEEIANSIIEIIAGTLKIYRLKINDKKTQKVNLNSSNHVRITGVSIVKNQDGTRHISVGRKAKNDIFWKSIELFDSAEIDYKQLGHLKGLLSFYLSIEKNGIENVYSEKMMQMLHNRGVNSVKELLDSVEAKKSNDSVTI